MEMIIYVLSALSVILMIFLAIYVKKVYSLNVLIDDLQETIIAKDFALANNNYLLELERKGK